MDSTSATTVSPSMRGVIPSSPLAMSAGPLPPSPARKEVPHERPAREPPTRPWTRPWSLDSAGGARRGHGAVRVRLSGRAGRHRRVHRRRDGCAVSALSAVQSAIVRLFRADMAVAAGLPDDPPPPLAETLARL